MSDSERSHARARACEKQVQTQCGFWASRGQLSGKEVVNVGQDFRVERE